MEMEDANDKEEIEVALNYEVLSLVYSTALKMLRNRGYMVNKSLINLSAAEFKSKFPTREDMMIKACLPYDTKQEIVILFKSHSRLSVKDMRIVLEEMQSLGINHSILITDSTNISSHVKSVTHEVRPKYRIEIFNENELLIDITEHFMVPVHILLSEKEKGDLLKRVKAKESQLPRIMLEDPICRYYGLDRGQVLKIIRESENAGRYVHYRIAL